MITKIGYLIATASEQDNSVVYNTPAGSLKRTGLFLGGGLGTLSGLGLIDDAISSGDLTGRETLYHGTSEASASGILNDGLKPTTPENGIRVNNLPEGEIRNSSYGKAYATRNPEQARGYAIQTETAFGNPYSEGKVVKINAPTWKMNVFRDRFQDLPASDLRRIMGFEDILSDEQVKDLAKKSYEDIRAIEGGIPATYIRGSKSYVKNSIPEFLEYASKNKARIARGAGKLLLGTGVAGAGVFGLKKGVDNLILAQREYNENNAKVPWTRRFFGVQKT